MCAYAYCVVLTQMQLEWVEEFLVGELVDLSFQLARNNCSCSTFVGHSLTAAVRHWKHISITQGPVPDLLCFTATMSAACYPHYERSASFCQCFEKGCPTKLMQDFAVFSLLTLVELKVPSALSAFPALTSFFKKMSAR